MPAKREWRVVSGKVMEERIKVGREGEARRLGVSKGTKERQKDDCE